MRAFGVVNVVQVGLVLPLCYVATSVSIFSVYSTFRLQAGSLAGLQKVIVSTTQEWIAAEDKQGTFLQSTSRGGTTLSFNMAQGTKLPRFVQGRVQDYLDTSPSI